VVWTRSFRHRPRLFERSTKQPSGSGSTVAKPGSSPHGFGGAIDIQELYREVGGSGNPAVNKSGKERNNLYKWMSVNGPKFGWYNPYRLADGTGTDEMWHWEYWGGL
jgi:LAS superfamily LD-carboxypeptidase LdcB